MIVYKTKEEVECMRQSCLMVGKVLSELAKTIKPGISTMQLNNLAEEFILDHKAVPAFKGYSGYPYASCISVNDAVVHGFPSKKELQEGDVVSIDIGVLMNGFHGDSAYSFVIGPTKPEILELLKITKESLYEGIAKARHGNRIGDISFAIQQHTEKKHGYGVVRELVGHGLGRELHEDPQVPNYGRKGTGSILKEGLVLAIEPMINLGTRDIVHDNDGWTVRTRDRKVSAHFEHDICITKGEADILSSFTDIEMAERNNAALVCPH